MGGGELSNDKRALVLNGSPKQGNSHSLGAYFAELLTQRGFTCELLHSVKHPVEETLSAIVKSDVILISFPLYVDSLPGSLTAVLEELADQWPAGDKSMLAIANCGFPESEQAATALGIIEQFALQVGARWLGGVSMGAGQSMGHHSVQEAGGMLRHVTAGLSLAADAIAKGEVIPLEAKQLVGRRIFPDLLYRVMAGQSFRKQAKQNKVNVYDRPHAWKLRK